MMRTVTTTATTTDNRTGLRRSPAPDGMSSCSCRNRRSEEDYVGWYCREEKRLRRQRRRRLCKPLAFLTAVAALFCFTTSTTEAFCCLSSPATPFIKNKALLLQATSTASTEAEATTTSEASSSTVETVRGAFHAYRYTKEEYCRMTSEGSAAAAVPLPSHQQQEEVGDCDGDVEDLITATADTSFARRLEEMWRSSICRGEEFFSLLRFLQHLYIPYTSVTRPRHMMMAYQPPYVYSYSTTTTNINESPLSRSTQQPSTTSATAITSSSLCHPPPPADKDAVGKPLVDNLLIADAEIYTGPLSPLASSSSSPTSSTTPAGDAIDADYRVMSELERRILSGVKYQHSNTDMSWSASSGPTATSDELVEVQRGVFCGYKVTEDEYNRLKNANANTAAATDPHNA